MYRYAFVLFAALTVSAGSVSAASYQMIDGTIVDPIQNTYGGTHSYWGVTLKPNFPVDGNPPRRGYHSHDLSYARLDYVNLFSAAIAGMDFRYASMRFANLSNISFSYPAAPWNPNSGDYIQIAKLEGSNLSHSNLSFSILRGVPLNGASLEFSSVALVNFSFADLSSADLSNAFSFMATYDFANLLDATFENAYLFGSDFSEALSVQNATWTGAKYSLNAVDNNGNPIPDTVFPAGMDQAWRDAAGMVAVPEPTTAVLVGLGLMGRGVRGRS